MVRKREAWTRHKDARRKRKPRRPPGPGLTIAELERLTLVPRRSVADYVRRGLLVAPEFRGTATRYQREHLLRLLGIRLLKAEGVTSLKQIHARLQTMGSQELESWVLARPLRSEVAQVLGASRPQRTVTSERPAIAATGGSAAVPRATWQRVEFLPGLELTWREDAGPLVQQLAERFTQQLAQLLLDASGNSPRGS
jgi:DNA-binding transcriptional MerR regulator